MFNSGQKKILCGKIKNIRKYNLKRKKKVFLVYQYQYLFYFGFFK